MPNSTDSAERPAERRRLVFLVGFMGSGKSSVGQALARKLGWAFVDLDQRVEERTARSVAEIFRTRGEGEFRELERQALAEILAQSENPQIVALGGGAFVQPDNADLIQKSGASTVFLDAPVEDLWHRCQEDPQERPLRQSFEQFESLYRQRRPRYLRASYRIDSSGKSAEQIAIELAAKLGNVDQENSK